MKLSTLQLRTLVESDIRLQAITLQIEALAPWPRDRTLQSNPLPRDRTHRTPVQLASILGAVNQHDWTVETVPVTELVSRQHWINAARLLELARGGRPNGGALPTAIRTEAGLCVLDGNHRAALAQLAGDTQFVVRTLNL